MTDFQAGPAQPVYIIDSSQLVENGGTFLVSGRRVIAITGDGSASSLWLTAAQTAVPDGADVMPVVNPATAGNYVVQAADGTLVDGGAVAGGYIDVQLGYNGKPADSAIDFVKLTRACTFARTAISSNVSGEGEAVTGPAADAVFSLYRVPRDGGVPVLIETITFTAANLIGNFSGNISSVPVTFDAFDTIRVVAPVAADADLADIRIGVRLSL